MKMTVVHFLPFNIFYDHNSWIKIFLIRQCIFFFFFSSWSRILNNVAAGFPSFIAYYPLLLFLCCFSLKQYDYGMFQYKILYKLIDLGLIIKEIYKTHIAMKHTVHKTVDKIANTKHTHVLKLRVYFQWGPTSQLKNTPVARKIRNSV